MIEKKQFAPNQKRVQQIRIKFIKSYPPYQYFNPHQFLAALNQAVSNRYDIQFIHVRYIVTKNKWQRQMNEIYQNQSDFQIERDSNNIFEISEREDGIFMKEYLLKDAVKLEQPPDYNPEIDEKKLEKERELQENKALRQIQAAVKEIMKLYNDNHDPQRKSIRSFMSFLSVFNRDEYTKNQYEIYAKGITHQPVIQKLEQDKNSKNPVQIKKSGAIIKLFLWPTGTSQPLKRLKKHHRISNWSFSTIYTKEQRKEYYEYFGTKDLENKAMKINNSVKFTSSIFFQERQNGSVESFSIVTNLWNEIVLKVTVKLAQISKIQMAREKIYPDSTEEKNISEYYFYLTYPPMYYISILKKEEANHESFMKNWDRVENFVLLDNVYIKDNYLLRYFLFNNTILKINCEKNVDYKVDGAIENIERVIKQFVGTIETNQLQETYKQATTKNTMKHLAKNFPFDKFLGMFRNHPEIDIDAYDKIWKIKYLLLVMARFNYVLPYQINEIINHLSEPDNIQSLDCYLYILWKTATNMWGYSNQEKRFYKYLIDQFENIKKLDVSNLLTRMMKSTSTIIYIFRVSLTPSGYLINPPTPEMKGRLMKQFSKESQFFLRVSLNEENEIELKNQKYITKMMFRKEMSRIKILGRQYIPLGWSPSQLRSFSLWYFHEIEDRTVIKRLKREYILSFLGDFDSIQNPAKKAARIGQSFSSSWTYDASKIKCNNIEDEYSEQRYMFTDGIGKISAYLLQMISLSLSIRELSVIQMRYKGAKGVLALDPSLEKNTIELRPSMIKYACNHKNAEKYLDILDWNKYKAGYLNRQIIILLKTLGVSDTLFFELQNEHIKTLSSMTFKDCSIFKHLNDDLNTEINNLQPANKTILDLLKAGFMLEKQPFFRGVLQTLKKNGYHQLKVKSNILVKNSARIIGIIDEYKVLQENQIYCSVHDPYALEPVREVIDSQIMITRNPCLHPADIRVVRGVGAEQIKKRFEKIGIKENRFEKFVNCVIFPMQGRYPLTSQISGSDLDGDNFFVCWDVRLIPKKTHPINLIDQASKPSDGKKNEVELKKIDEVYDEMLDFFINYTNYEKLGQIDNSHLVHADRNLKEYANDQKCMKLSEIHGKAVDFPKTGYCPPVPSELFVIEYPDFMEKQNSDSYQSLSILGHLYRQIKQKIQNLLDENTNIGQPEIDIDIIYKYPFDQTDEEVRECMQISQEYEKDLQNLIHLVGVDSEYEIYSGNFSTVKNKVKTFGKNRLISSILNLRERYFSKFFQNLENDQEKYISCPSEDYLRVPNYFSFESFRKAQLMYLVTYIRKFHKLKIEDDEKQQKQRIYTDIQKLRYQIFGEDMEDAYSTKEGKYCGYIWFVIPKVIINMKITMKSSRNKMLDISNLEDIQNEESNIEYGDDDYDDGDL